MLRKEIFAVIFFLFAGFAYADIHDSIKLGETKHYLTPDKEFTVTLNKVDSFSERATFVVNGMSI